MILYRVIYLTLKHLIAQFKLGGGELIGKKGINIYLAFFKQRRKCKSKAVSKD